MCLSEGCVGGVGAAAVGFIDLAEGVAEGGGAEAEGRHSEAGFAEESVLHDGGIVRNGGGGQDDGVTR